MSYRTVSTILTDQESDSTALSAARGLAAREGAHLEVTCLGIDPTRYEALPAGSAIVLDEGREDARAQADSLAAWARQAVPESENRVTVEDTVVAQLALDRHIARVARYTDLVVTARPYGDNAAPIAPIIFEAALFGARVPVMVAPKPDLPIFNRICVAWNETDESLTAVRKALPLLTASSHVDIVMIDPPARSAERSDPGGALALMLARHGVTCEVSVLSKTLPRVSDVLMRFTADHASDLLVMGAYGHSRFREALIGGATRDLLEEAELPLFLAH